MASNLLRRIQELQIARPLPSGSKVQASYELREFHAPQVDAINAALRNVDGLEQRGLILDLLDAYFHNPALGKEVFGSVVPTGMTTRILGTITNSDNHRSKNFRIWRGLSCGVDINRDYQHADSNGENLLLSVHGPQDKVEEYVGPVLRTIASGCSENFKFQRAMFPGGFEIIVPTHYH
jgi:hypothetical protein